MQSVTEKAYDKHPPNYCGAEPLEGISDRGELIFALKLPSAISFKITFAVIQVG